MWNSALLRELSLVLVIKTLLLAALWFLFFRHPPAPGVDAAASGALIASHPAAPAREVVHDR